MGINPYIGIMISNQKLGWGKDGWETIPYTRYWLQFWWLGRCYELRVY